MPTTERLAWRRCTVTDLGTVSTTDDDGARLLAILTEYFAQFAAPMVPPNANLFNGARCKCGAPLTGLFGTFRYGLAHGEGACTACGHPARADHYVTDADGSDLLAINRFPLLYFEAEASC